MVDKQRKKVLAKTTEDYWREAENNEPDNIFDQIKLYYIYNQESLFFKEWQWLEKYSERLPLQATREKCKTLVLLVGFSLEPLLQGSYRF